MIAFIVGVMVGAAFTVAAIGIAGVMGHAAQHDEDWP